MLGTGRVRSGGRMYEQSGVRNTGFRRRHGSVSSLPSSSVSGRPVRDRRRTDDRRKVRDIRVRAPLTPSRPPNNLRFHFLHSGRESTNASKD